MFKAGLRELYNMRPNLLYFLLNKTIVSLVKLQIEIDT